MNKISDHIFIACLQSLNIKHTNYFSKKYFEEHPYKGSLYGLSRMLSDYGIEKVAKIPGTAITWSEAGMSYFLSNIFILIISPYLISFSTIINRIILPYSLWNARHQKYRAHQWCPLCIITHKANSLKAKNESLVALLKNKKKYHINNVTNITWGDPLAKSQITVITNPYCKSCAKTHRRINNLLQITVNKIHIQYILFSFKDKLKNTNKLLTAAYQSNTNNKSYHTFNDWFYSGKRLKDDFFSIYNITINEKIVDKFNRQEKMAFRKWSRWNSLYIGK